MSSAQKIQKALLLSKPGIPPMLMPRRPVRNARGVIKLTRSVLWADEPERAITLLISRHLNQMTSATVAPQPWPLEETPEATVDIRVEQLVALNRNRLCLSGQYFIGGQEIDTYDTDEARPKVVRRTSRSRSELFDIEVPLPSAGPNTGPSAETGALAAAQSEALRLLAERIARDLAR